MEAAPLAVPSKADRARLNPLDALACGGLPGRPNALGTAVASLTMDAVLALVVEFVTLPEALLIAAAVMGGNWLASTVCAAPQPPDPVLTALDFFNLKNTNDGIAYADSQARVIQWFAHVIWPIWCDCADGSVPPPANPVDPPPGALNPGLPPGVAATSCGPGNTVTWAQPGTTFTQYAFGAPPHNQLPPNATSVHMTGRIYPRNLPQPPITAVLEFGSAAGSTSQYKLDINYPSFTGSVPFDVLVPVSSFTSTVSITATATGGNLNFNVDMFSEAFCNGQSPGQPVAPCCPPDPSLDARLTQIQVAIQFILQSLHPATAGYRLGTRHAAIAGSGSLPANNLVGLLVEILAAPPTKVQPGNPPYIWDMGWLSCSTPDGFIDEKRLTRTSQIWLPPLMPISDSFGFYLFPGVTADITELLPA